MVEFSLLLTNLNESLKKSSRLLVTTYNILEEENSKKQYDLTSLSKACDFVAVYYVCYHENGTDDIFDDPNVLWKFLYFDKLVNFTADVSNVVFGISFSFRKYILRDGKYYMSSDHFYNEFCEWSCLENCEESYNPVCALNVVRYRDELTHEDFVFSFAGSRSIANQVRFAMKRHFGGVSASIVSNDDVYGTCGLDTDTWDDFKVPDGMGSMLKRTNAKFPLLKTINEAITLSLDEMKYQTIPPKNTTISRSPRIVSEASLFLLGGIVTLCLAFHVVFNVSCSF